MQLPLVTAALLGTAFGVCAQMSGAYNIDPAGSGARNFKTFTAATKQLFLEGVNGPVTFIVAAGTYNESFFLLPVQGASSANTITFFHPIPGSVKLVGTQGDTVTLFAGLSWYRNGYYVFDGMEFASSVAGAVRGGEYTDEVEFRNCTFQAAHPGGSAFPRAMVYVNGANTAARWRFVGNTIVLPGGSVYGIYGSQVSQWEFQRNSVDLNNSTYGIYLINNNNAQNRIYNNLFFGNLSTSNQAAAIHVDLSNLNNEICHNTFFVITTGTGSCVRTFGTQAYPNKFWGNVFNMIGPGTCLNVSPTTASLQYWESDANLYNAPAGNIAALGTTTYNTLSAWQQATNKDANSLQADPLLRQTQQAPYDLRPMPNSPVKDRGVRTPAYVTEDYERRLRDGLPDLGAYEMSGFALFGTGCAGSGAATPELSSTGAIALGSTTFTITLRKALGGTNAALGIGTSRTRFGSINLPFDLGGGCNLLIDLPITSAFPVAGSGAGNGTANVPLPIPNNPSLLGGSTYFQWFVVDPATQSNFGVTTSNGGVLQL